MVEPIPPMNRLRIRLFLSLESPRNRLQKIWNRNTSNSDACLKCNGITPNTALLNAFSGFLQPMLANLYIGSPVRWADGAVTA